METTDGKCCIFLFIYQGKTYYGCTNKNHDRPWCSLTFNYDTDKKWGNCKGSVDFSLQFVLLEFQLDTEWDTSN